MTTTTNDITAAQWLDIRDHVTKQVRSHATPNTQAATAQNIAEDLLRAGLVDIDAVLEAIKPKTVSPTPLQKSVASTASRLTATA